MSKEMYCVTADGDLAQTSSNNGNQSKIIVDSDARKIYLYVPDEAPVREKFIAARLATELKRKNGLVYKIQNIDDCNIQ